MVEPPRFALARDRVRHVGDPVAFVVAETRIAAHDAADAVVAEYRELPAIADAVAALDPEAPQLWGQAPGNLSYRFRKGDADAVQAALASAAHVVELALVNNRIVINATETRGAIARYDAAGFHLLFSGAGVHALQAQLADSVFRVPRAQMHVACPDVGGGFGVKNALYPEWIMLLWAARHFARPVKWIGERAEDFVSTAQGRDNITRARLGLDADGGFLALDVSTVANLGAYLSSGGPGSSTNAPANAIGSGYDIPAIFMDVQGVFTNTVPIDAYRGAGKPEVNYMMERLIDAAARDCGFDRIDAAPPQPGARLSLSQGAGHGDRRRPLRRQSGRCGGRRGCRRLRGAPRRHSRQRGRLRGIGVTCFMETARGAPNEGAELRFALGWPCRTARRHAVQRHGP